MKASNVSVRTGNHVFSPRTPSNLGGVESDISRYYEDLVLSPSRHILGASSIGWSSAEAGGPAVHIGATSPEAAQFIRDLVEPSIQGVPIRVEATGQAAENYEPGFVDARNPNETAAVYGYMLHFFDHVQDVHNTVDADGRRKLEVVTDSIDSAEALNALVADNIRGVLVEFSSPNTPDPWFRKFGYESWD